jgi:hypothetical protein
VLVDAYLTMEGDERRDETSVSLLSKSESVALSHRFLFYQKGKAKVQVIGSSHF